MQSPITGYLRWHVSVFIVQSQRRWRHAEGEQEMCRWKTSKPWISRKARAEEIMRKRRLQERQCHLARLAPADKTALVFLADMHPSLALSLRSICWLCLTGLTVGRCWVDKICQSNFQSNIFQYHIFPLSICICFSYSLICAIYCSLSLLHFCN